MARAQAREERSAGGVVYRWVDGQPRFLLIRDSYRNWGFPKGHLKSGESAEGAARREVAEETGLADLVVGPELAAIDWSFRFRGERIHKRCHFFLMESRAGEARPQRAEGITECCWLGLAEAMRHLSYANARGVLEAASKVLSGAAHELESSGLGTRDSGGDTSSGLGTRDSGFGGTR